ncbi:MAG: hypothetical protein JKY37_01180, partial [Nannocystaceae bacterium]|nr:hypothetical protein [Nannocystaceae bacterium]
VAVAASAILFVVPGLSSERVEDSPNLAPRTAQPNIDGVRPVVVPPPKPADVATDKERTLQALDAEAQQKWRNGDLEGARLTFRRMTEREGEHRYVELAFADLVTLARQQGKPGRIAALWASYLGRFPRGRFASDARAAICGRPGAPSACLGRAGDGGLGQDPAR